MRLIRAAALAAVALGASPAFGGLTEDLEGLLRQARSGSMSFTQEVTDPEGVLTNSEGTFAYERPARFSIQYVSPDRVRIVSDGETVWVHDQDLGQVIVSSFENAPGAQSFLLVLSSPGSADDFATDSFTDQATGLRWLVLDPRDPDAVRFERCEIGFGPQGEIAAVRILDLVGNELVAKFADVGDGVPDQGLFTFVPPDGAEVVRQ